MSGLLNVLLYLCVILSDVTFYLCIFKPGIKKHFGRRYILAALCVAIGAVLSYLSTAVTAICLLGHIFSLLILLFISDTGISQLLMDLMLVFFSAELLVSSFKAWVTVLSGASHDYLSELISWLLIFITIMILYFCVLRKLSDNAFRLTGALRVIISLLIAVAGSAVGYCFVAIQQLEEEFYSAFLNIGRLLVGLVGISMTLLCYILVYNINSKRGYEERYNAALLYNREQSGYFKEKSEKNRLLQKFRHDYKTDILIINRLAHQGKINELEEYVSHLEEGLSSVEESRYYNTGDDILNVILAHYLSELKNCDLVDVKGKISERKETDDRDFAVIVSNLIKNAVEEINEDNENSYKCFVLSVAQDAEGITIHLDNSCRKKGTEKKKGEAHFGLGISIVREIIEKSGGFFEYKKENEMFRTVVWLPETIKE